MGGVFLRTRDGSLNMFLIGINLARKVVVMYSYKFNRGVEQLGSSSGS